MESIRDGARLRRGVNRRDGCRSRSRRDAAAFRRVSLERRAPPAGLTMTVSVHRSTVAGDILDLNGSETRVTKGVGRLCYAPHPHPRHTVLRENGTDRIEHLGRGHGSGSIQRASRDELHGLGLMMNGRVESLAPYVWAVLGATAVRRGGLTRDSGGCLELRLLSALPSLVVCLQPVATASTGAVKGVDSVEAAALLTKPGGTGFQPY
mmetsp:Transcript_10228/g.18469  ORF Transcript_10228/g.18469 Transcript_10228/m.18469 type:complete len:208 (+) Transcript_10228:189-812(+)